MRTRIVICGAGIVGMSMALALATLGQEVLILAPDELENFSIEKNTTSYDYNSRVYTISQSSKNLLEKIDIWNMLSQHQIVSVEGIEVYGNNKGKVNLSAWQACSSQIAWTIESDQIKSVLAQAIQKEKVPFLKDQLIGCKNGTITTLGGKKIFSELIIGADGKKSLLRNISGIRFREKDSGDISFVARLSCRSNHQNTAFQWFTNNSGILALLPMPNQISDKPQMSMVWTVPKEYAKGFMYMDPIMMKNQLEQKLDSITNKILGKLSILSKINTFPIVLLKSDMIAPGIVLIGDASHCIHPLAGQGLNLGLGDVEILSKLISESGNFLNDFNILKNYRKIRESRVLMMSLSTFGLRELFSIDNIYVDWLRNVGMICFDKVPCLKKMLIGFASRN